MTKEDLDRDDSERRRRNRWVTDAVYCSDLQMFVVVNSTRSLIVYEASGLNHVPCWLIIGMPNVINSMCYRGSTECNSGDNEVEGSTNVLFLGDCYGAVMHLTFLQSQLPFRKKYTDKMSIYYWPEIELQKEYVKIGSSGFRHYEEIKQITYFSKHNALISCSADPSASVIIQYMAPNRKPYTFKMRKVLKVWNLDEHKCLEVIEMKFPCFQVLGKSIEFGVNSIYPGPKRNIRDFTIPYSNKTGTLFSLDDVEQMSEDHTDTNGTNINIWERSHILVTCCSYVAKISLSFEDVHIESTLELSIYPPPPLQNSVLVPSSWNFQDKEGSAFITSDESVDADFKIEEKMKELEFVLSKDFLGTFGTKSDINRKIAILESKKMQMKGPVEQGAAYLALDLYDLEELNLSKDLPIPDRQTKRLFENTEQGIKDAMYKDQVFSDLSSSRSRSSDTSLEAECQ
nr:unnamed protein product [Callosobruchus analis]